jgi:alpha/beta superfamily hydrolase
MGQTVTPAQPQDYGTWVGATLREIGVRRPQQLQPALPAQGGLVAAGGVRPQLPPAAPGKGNSRFPGAGFLRNAAFGTRDERRGYSFDATLAPYNPQQPDDDDTNPPPWHPKRRDAATEIGSMVTEGTAAPVQIAANGRNLQGNFYSAVGHNLKAANGAPDLTRPAVLLLTGSGGRAEDQGLDVAKFYADSGANVLSMNYGGYGDSADITPTEESVNQDAQAMLQHLVDLGYDPDKIVIHGYSMGGAVAGKLKEAMENPPGGAGAVQMRGLVMDRPMLSMAHGVMTHAGLPAPVGRAVASYTRQAIGKMGARGAIGRSDQTTTPVVVTSDEGEYAQKAEDFRTALQTNPAPGQARTPGKVTGSQSHSDHFNHKANITQNADALRAMVQQDRTGQPDAAVGQPVEGLSDPLLMLSQKINASYGAINTAVTGLVQIVGALEQAMPNAPRNMVQGQIDLATSHLNDVRDLLQAPGNTVPAYIKPQLKLNQKDLRTSLQRLMAIQQQLAQANQAVVPAAPTRALIDAIADGGEDAVNALTAVGGPSLANLALENEVIAAEDALQLYGAAQHPKAQAIGQMVNQILLRRLNAMSAAAPARRRRARPARQRGGGTGNVVGGP